MNIPKEIYFFLYVSGDNIKITKILRSLCRLSLSAGYQYFNLLLKKDVIFYDNSMGEFSINNQIERTCRKSMIGLASKPVSFNITFKDLYNGMERSKDKNRNKEIITIDPRFCG